MQDTEGYSPVAAVLIEAGGICTRYTIESIDRFHPIHDVEPVTGIGGSIYHWEKLAIGGVLPSQGSLGAENNTLLVRTERDIFRIQYIPPYLPGSSYLYSCLSDIEIYLIFFVRAC